MSAREQLASRIRAGEVVFAPLALDALTARIAAQAGFGAVYLSGGALGFASAVSEALLTVTELAHTARHIVQRADVPLIVDVGVGFGDAVHVARTVWEMENAGAAAIELEDQVAPKRVSHHRGIEHLVATEDMVAKIRVAVEARMDPDLLLVARTGAVRNESFAAGVERGVAYREAGADLVMLAPSSEAEWDAASAAIGGTLAAIVSLDLFPEPVWRRRGFGLVIDPFTAQVEAVRAVRAVYESFGENGKTGTDRGEIMQGYRELAGLAGLDPLFAIEDATTETGDSDQ